MKKEIISIFLSLILILIIFIAGCKSEDIKICEIMNVSYEEPKEYQEGTLAYEITSTYKYTNFKDNVIIGGSVVKVKNADTQPGNFTVEVTFTLANGTSKILQLAQIIPAEESKEFKQETVVDTDVEEEIHIGGMVIPPEKIMIRNVTKYRMEEVCY
ncbi:MAG: hypothetical protein U9R34_07210 [Nanoarchaeota archaeon]|nr:hypothetical protein [Nanoarchaeota archaeon]